MTVNVTVETIQGYTEVIPFGTMESAKYFEEVIASQDNPDRIWSSTERFIIAKDITRVISVEEEH